MSPGEGAGFFSSALATLSVVASSPLALAGLLMLTLAATFLYWKQGSYKSLATTLETLPETDRLEHIRLSYGVRPQGGVSASAWLKSRRQTFLFGSYVSTLLVALLALMVVFGHVVARPGGLHREKMLNGFSDFYLHLEEYELVAGNLRDAFALSGELAIDPDPATDALLTAKIKDYVRIYDDLATHNEQYTRAVNQWLDDSPDLTREVSAVMESALTDLHEGGLLQFNNVAYRRTEQIKAWKAANPGKDPSDTVRDVRSQGASEIQALSSTVGDRLEGFGRRLRQLKVKVTGNA